MDKELKEDRSASHQKGAESTGDNHIRDKHMDYNINFKRLLPWGGGLLALLLFLGFASPLFTNRFFGPQLKPAPFTQQLGTDNLPADGSPETVAAQVSPVVVGIVSQRKVQEWLGDRRQMVEEASGTGVVFDSRGYIFTNYHVIEGAQDLVVNMPNGSKLRGTVVGSDRTTDLAVVKVAAGQRLPAARLGNSDNLRVGQTAIAIGNPIGMEFQRTVTVGVISGLNRVLQVGERMFRLIQTDATINPGNSGGPLVNTRGEVIGINTIKIDMPKVEGMGFAIPINTARPIISELMAKGKISRPWMGVALVAPDEAARYGVSLSRGLLVIKVVPGSPAADAKISQGDIITQVEGKTVNDFAHFYGVLQGKQPGELIKLTVLKDSKPETVMVRLAETPA
ncbi:MAG TPA: trypsin-like peptidase domain-containing protein [Bacillota bacterium]|nr:trypsin-like peptidase domain-containing protein [Bacillota bacterium]